MRWDRRGPIGTGYLAHGSQLFFTSIHTVFSASYIYAVSKSSNIAFAGQVVYKPLVQSAFSEALVLITNILIPAVNYVFVLHRIVIGPVTIRPEKN